MECHLLYIFFCPPIVVLINWITARFFEAWPYSNSVLKALNGLLRVLSTNVLRPFSNLLALLYNSSSLLSGRVWIFLNATTTSPALDCKSLLRKFLWISVILLFVLNFSIAYLILAVLPFWSRFSSILRRAAFSWLVIWSWILAMLAAYLHLLNDSAMFPCKFLKSCIRAFSFKAVSLFSMKALSHTALIA